ncbi:TPA: acetylornithine/succinylornithine family transaminase [Legionella pneumophila subsp. pneumophila]|uniref:aspartate aminotransferase family protein n=1 Tax=Legionella sp. PATHC039 TaxID=2992042 RepID=UPI001A261D1B|nr:aspartate aminotransferase family protein [Legionella sp. PATHC039]HAT8859240.1 acetylornithine/succinylornithine family transaminase [Legionella pneumophila subsp. pneumophila]MCW8396401.1 aspartate aminotransferase family protein [Legionella sp. PATHC039]HAT8890004.1 acetylornithine/succinylornithine family transaminase [Legionella pneumophila subsp. pneumophila]HAT9651058.1 acetylornithine/succinylornithine family transaminase [Legionella pneumophila subsp. pneumophila]HAT9920146.1 acety
MSLITSYSPMPVTFTHGEGVWLYDEQGKKYLDGLSGIAVCGLGHAHPDVTRTIQEQAARLIHTSNVFHIKEQELLAAKLTSMARMEQVFFANSGAEANEAAIKLTRLFGHKKGIETPSIIVMEKAFHGRTMATLTASGSRKVQAGFEPLVPGFIRAPFNDLDAIHTIAANREDVVAVMVEPIQGEGGIYPAEEGYLRALANLCEQNDWMLILDEIQTGNGRTGKLYSCMHYNIQPDILTTAKGLGNGMPIGACLMNKRAKDLFKPGNHGSTFGGNPLACATALTVLEVIERDKLCERVTKNSALLMDKLISNLGEHPHVKAIRGKGYMIGIELDRPANEMRVLGLENQVLFNITAETVVRLLPPLIISEDEIDELVNRITRTVNQFTNQ